MYGSEKIDIELKELIPELYVKMGNMDQKLVYQNRDYTK
jgi:hypothetical protein